MRSIKELLIILKKDIEAGNMVSGYCRTMSSLCYRELINYDELNELRRYLYLKRKPSFGRNFWFPKNEILSRINFLDELINQLP